MPVTYDRKTGRWHFTLDLEEVRETRRYIAQLQDYLERDGFDDYQRRVFQEGIDSSKRRIADSGFTVDPRPDEPPEVEETPEPEPIPAPALPVYIAYFRQDNGTTDAWEFPASSWLAASKQARDILNWEYRERLECAPYTAIRGKETFVVYPRGKKPVGKRFADIIGLKRKEE